MYRLILLLVMGSFLSLGTQVAEAQWSTNNSADVDSRFESRGYRELKRIKAEIADLLKENKVLEGQYAKIYTEYKSLERNMLQYSGEMDEMSHQTVSTLKDHKENQAKLNRLGHYRVNRESDSLIYQSKVNFLRGQLIDIEERLRLRELKLKELDYAHREVGVEHELQEYLAVEKRESQAEKLERLRNDAIANLDQEKEVLLKLKEMKKQKITLPTRIERLKNDILSLENKRTMLIESQRIKEKEISLLKTKRDYVVKSSDLKMVSKDKEMTSLEESVSDLEGEYESLNENIQASLYNQGKRKEIIETVISIDRENHELRQKMLELQEKLSELQ